MPVLLDMLGTGVSTGSSWHWRPGRLATVQLRCRTPWNCTACGTPGRSSRATALGGLKTPNAHTKRRSAISIVPARHIWRARRVGRRVGFPKFKKKGRTDHFRLNDPVRVQPRAVVLPRIGPVRTKEATTKLQGRILSATCRREADRWYVSLCVRTDRPDPIAVKGVAVGIDRGLKTFAVLSNGDIIDSPQALERGLRKLRRLNKAVARKQPGSRRRAKARMAVARHHRRMRNRRRDALHKATTNLARTKSTIVLEDLHVAGLARNRRVARRLLDQGWAEFQSQLAYKTTWYGSKLLLAPPFYPSSRTCSGCGAVRAKLRLSERIYSCGSCGLRLNRDLNAARNLVHLAKASPQVLRRLETPVERAALASPATTT
jgi:putative transposase